MGIRKRPNSDNVDKLHAQSQASLSAASSVFFLTLQRTNLGSNGLQKNSFFSIAAIWPETSWAIVYGVDSDYFEPAVEKEGLRANGVYYFKPGNPQIERYFSNCSSNFHFIDEETAIRVKHYLIDAGFIRRFDS